MDQPDTGPALDVQMGSLHLSAPTGLEDLPTDVLVIILSYLDTAQSLARLASTCKVLQRLVALEGWYVFVRTRFNKLNLPSMPDREGWQDLARRLTSHSRDWDRRAFVLQTYWRQDQAARPYRSPYPWRNYQTAPCHIIVDTQLSISGSLEYETVAWGAGEDLVTLVRQKSGHATKSQELRIIEGIKVGYAAGKDDVSALQISKSRHASKNNGVDLLVGRTSGDLRQVSTDQSTFGQTIQHFQPPTQETTSASDPVQSEIQSLDTCQKSNTLAAATKDSIFFYPLSQAEHDSSAVSHVEPAAAINLKSLRDSKPFKFVRTVKFMPGETLVMGMASSPDPLRYVTVTPDGRTVASASQLAGLPSDTPEMATVRAVKPLDLHSVGGGSGKTVLSAWDDGTIRLQDLRTPSPFDQIYQDQFEPDVPISSLVNYGLDRFIGGSARRPVLKIFDFRWPTNYHYTDALPCRSEAPYPAPRPPTLTKPPPTLPILPNGTAATLHSSASPLAIPKRCNYLLGITCTWHSLSRHPYYRPNCNIYIPIRPIKGAMDAPVHTLALASDHEIRSPTIYAGLSDVLVEMTLRSSSSFYSSSSSLSSPTTTTTTTTLPPLPPSYAQQATRANVIETGDGTLLGDVSQSSRMPTLRDQYDRVEVSSQQSRGERSQHRLDDWLQYARDFPVQPPPLEDERFRRGGGGGLGGIGGGMRRGGRRFG